MAKENLNEKFEGQISFDELSSAVKSPSPEFTSELQGLLGIHNMDADVDINKLRDLAEQYLLDIFLSISSREQK